MSADPIHLLSGEGLALPVIRHLLRTRSRLGLTAEAHAKVAESRVIVDRLQAGEHSYYGINTGFGALAHTRIAPGDIEKLQENLILSHAVGVGREVDPQIVAVTVYNPGMVGVKTYE